MAITLVAALLILVAGLRGFETLADSDDLLLQLPTLISAKPEITSMSHSVLAPAELLTLDGRGFGSGKGLSVRFSNAQGFSLDVPVAEATSRSATVAVPAVIDTSTGNFTEGAVDVTVIKKIGARQLESNTVSGLDLRALPTPQNSTAGLITLGYLLAAQDEATTIKNDISGTSLDSTELQDALSALITDLNTLAGQVQNVVDTPSSTFDLGTVDGVAITVDAAALANIDRMIAGLMEAMGNTQPTAGGFFEFFVRSALAERAGDDCMQPESQQVAQSLDDLLGQDQQDMRQSMNTYLGGARTPLCGAPEKIADGFKFVAAWTSVSVAGVGAAFGTGAALALARVTAVFTSINLQAAAGFIGIAGTNNQDDETSKGFAKLGIQQLQAAFKPAAEALKPKIAGAQLVELWNDVGDIVDALADDDGDSVEDLTDNCPDRSNSSQTDTDGDGDGDACDDDDDNDGVGDGDDNCPLIDNPSQTDSDGDGAGNDCDNDDDGDGVDDGSDNCPVNANPGQLNTDGDGQGDACDNDDDNDGIADGDDNCPKDANANQADGDFDGTGDVCEPPVEPLQAPNTSSPGIDIVRVACDGTSFTFGSTKQIDYDRVTYEGTASGPVGARFTVSGDSSYPTREFSNWEFGQREQGEQGGTVWSAAVNVNTFVNLPEVYRPSIEVTLIVPNGPDIVKEAMLDCPGVGTVLSGD